MPGSTLIALPETLLPAVRAVSAVRRSLIAGGGAMSDPDTGHCMNCHEHTTGVHVPASLSMTDTADILWCRGRIIRKEPVSRFLQLKAKECRLVYGIQLITF